MTNCSHQYYTFTCLVHAPIFVKFVHVLLWINQNTVDVVLRFLYRPTSKIICNDYFKFSLVLPYLLTYLRTTVIAPVDVINVACRPKLVSIMILFSVNLFRVWLKLLWSNQHTGYSPCVLMEAYSKNRLYWLISVHPMLPLWNC